jgi:pimeloyl-ACP methyl ester carboxylesterase
MNPRAEKIAVRGIEVSMRRGGVGEPLLYLHSGSAESTTWNAVHEALAADFDVIAPIHPGFPGSGGLERIRGIGDLVLHYVDLLDALRLPRAHVVGSSLGGWIGVELASLYPERAGTLVMADAAGLWIDADPPREMFGIPPGELAQRLFFDQQHPIAQMLHAAGESSWAVPPPDDVLLAFHQSTEATARVAWNPYLHDPALERRLDRIRCPTLVLWGENDRLIPPSYGERFRERIPGALLRYIKACGHLPAIEKPAAFAHEVSPFLHQHSILPAD